MSMGGLIAVLQQMITDDIVNEGEYAYPGLVDVYRQELAYRLGDGFYFFVHTPKGSQRVFTWRQLRNVVEGLRLFLIVGERNYCTKFQSWDGPWRWIHVGQELGEGGIVLDRNGAEKVADRKELSESVME